MNRVLLFLIVFLTFSCNNDDSGETEVIAENPNEEAINCENEDFLQNNLSKLFANALISDHCNNIKRDNPIKIIQYDQTGNRIKTNYNKIDQLLTKGSNDESWFIVQGSQASTVIEINDVDTNSGWISLGNTYSGGLSTDATIEFFNPFINYSIINNRPLFEPYPSSVAEGNFNYIQPGGIIEKSDGSYVLYLLRH